MRIKTEEAQGFARAKIQVEPNKTEDTGVKSYVSIVTNHSELPQGKRDGFHLLMPVTHWLPLHVTNSQALPDLRRALSFIRRRRLWSTGNVEVAESLTLPHRFKRKSGLSCWGYLQAIPSRGIGKNLSLCFLAIKMSLALDTPSLPWWIETSKCQDKSFSP